MNLNLNKEDFSTKFLSPVSKITDSCVFTITDTSVYTLTNTSDNSVILFAEYKTDTEFTDPMNLNIGNVKKLGRVFDCIHQEYINLNVDSNSISYEDESVKFKYHLLDDSAVGKTPLNLKKLQSLQFDCSFVIPFSKFQEIIKGSSFASDTNKLYFYTKNDKVFAELSDKQINNTDSITFQATDSYDGIPLKTELPLNLETIRTVGSSIKADCIRVNINTDIKFLVFEISNESFTLKYVTSALVK